MTVEGENIVNFNEMKLNYGDTFLFTFKSDISPTGQPSKRKYDTRWTLGHENFVLTADQSD